MNKNAKPVLVTLVSGSHSGDSEPEELVRLRCQGELKETSTGYLLRYQEVQTDDETGKTVSQDVILSLQPDRVTMNRLGAFGTTMVFVKDRRFEGAYHTPYGDLGLALFATQVSCRLGPDSGSVHLEYQLDMQGNYAAVQTIDVTYTAEGAPAC
ncbi:MAG: DUF1934 domain-containing protein [Clostridiales bacterium]|nr:DUF1934 domain-containing protein [Clostridiales bacterium]